MAGGGGPRAQQSDARRLPVGEVSGFAGEDSAREGEQRHAGSVGHVEAGEAEGRAWFEQRQTRVLELGIVGGDEVVEAHYGVAIVEQPLGEVEADEAAGDGDEDGVRHGRVRHGGWSQAWLGQAWSGRRSSDQAW